MKIYTGNIYGEDLVRARELGMGIMIASSPSNWKPTAAYRDLPCALDNGAFRCWQKGYPFMDRVFQETLEKCYRLDLPLDFIVCPDIVMGGMRSLLFSVRYATERLVGCPRMALAVQDGLTPTVVEVPAKEIGFSCIFVGGSVDWKWQTAPEWVRFAHDQGMMCHIGRAGTVEALERAQGLGADSVDSVNFVRNDSWSVIERFTARNLPLFRGAVKSME